MRLQEKSISKLALTDLLRRKRKDLKTYLKETGIVTYERLVRSCTSIGVVPPSEEEFRNVLGNPTTPQVSSPTDGILVLEPPNEVMSETQNSEEAAVQEELLDLTHLEDSSQQKVSKQSSKKKKKPLETEETPED